MHINQVLAGLAFLGAVVAWDAPVYTSYNRVWQANFAGAANTIPSADNWNYITGDRNDNNEFQRYTKNTANIKVTGDGALQIIPRKDSSAPLGWTSARIESKRTVTPAVGKITRLESSVKVGANAAVNKQSIWPAVWMMGQKFREGVAWPLCGELDLFENINGQALVHGVAHCDVYPGGVCQEPVGLVNVVELNDSNYHVYRVEFNRKPSDWTTQTISWLKDGVLFHRISGADVGSQAAWAALCHSPYYFILNVAVGGNWPGSPNELTYGGPGSRLEVGYVAHYVSK